MLSVWSMPGTILGPEHIIAKKAKFLPNLMGEREQCEVVIKAIERKKPNKGAFFYINIHICITENNL